MPSIGCGFVDDGQGHSGQELLVRYGPTLLVDIGFDPTYNPQTSKAPPTTGIQQVAAVVDTGAAISCIDKSLATRLGLPVVDRQVSCNVHCIPTPSETAARMTDRHIEEDIFKYRYIVYGDPEVHSHWELTFFERTTFIGLLFVSESRRARFESRARSSRE